MRAAVIAALGLSLAAAAGAAAPGPVAGRVEHAGRWLVDGQGRVIVLHGFNVVRKNPPFVRTEFGETDAQLLADEGFTVARIGFIREGVEPEPGRYDDAYIARVLELDSILRRHGIRTVVDFHQDIWSRSDHRVAGAENPRKHLPFLIRTTQKSAGPSSAAPTTACPGRWLIM